VLIDEWGRSSIENLYAIGECSCSGLHGANRLASTSLLEGLVWGNRSGKHIERNLSNLPLFNFSHSNDVPPWDESGLTAEADSALIQGDMQTIQNIMWHYVGLERNAERLSRAMRELRHLWSEIETFYGSTKLSDGLIGLRNAVEVSLIIAHAALHNRQSRGCHFRDDTIVLDGVAEAVRRLKS
jgi:L-aspartate oxidase